MSINSSWLQPLILVGSDGNYYIKECIALFNLVLIRKNCWLENAIFVNYSRRESVFGQQYKMYARLVDVQCSSKRDKRNQN